MAPKVLFVLSSHSTLGDTGKPTGWYLPEFAHPYYQLVDKTEISVASPAGGVAPLDPSSVEAFKDDAESTKFLLEKQDLWKSTQKLSTFAGRASEFAAIFYVGGHGPMFDLAGDATSQQVIREFYEAGKVVAAVCHGPAALVNVQLSNGAYLVKDNEITAFSNVEEDQVQLSSSMPFLLETRLVENGAKFVKADKPWDAKVVTSGEGGRILTGQNPASASPLGAKVAEAIKV